MPKYRKTLRDIRGKIKRLTLKSKYSTLAITCFVEQLVDGEQRLYNRIRDIKADAMEIIAIKHDKGKNREHWHIIIRVPDSRKRGQVSTVLNKLGIAFRPSLDDALLANRALETCGDYAEYATYLLHQTVKAKQDGKAPYDATDFVSNLSSADIDAVLSGYTPTKRRLNTKGIATLIDAAYEAGYRHRSFQATVSGYYILGLTPQQRKKFEDSFKKGARDSIQSNPQINRVVIEIEYPKDAPSRLKDKIRYAAQSSFGSDYRIAIPTDGGRVEFDELTDAIIIPDFDISKFDGDWTAQFTNFTDDRIKEIKYGRGKARLWCGSIFLIVHAQSNKQLDNSFFGQITNNELKFVRVPQKGYTSEEERDRVTDVLRRFISSFNKNFREYTPEKFLISLDDILFGDDGLSRDIRINFVDGAHTGVTGDNSSGIEGPMFNGILDAAPTGYTMRPRFVGYDAPDSTVTLDIINVSASTDRTVSALFPGGCFTVAYGADKDGTALIPASGHRDFVITPKAGLPDGTYRDTLTITGDGVEPIKFNILLEVRPRIYSFRAAYCSNYKEAQNLLGKNGGNARINAWADSTTIVRDATATGGIKLDRIIEDTQASLSYITLESTGNSPLRDIKVSECTLSGADVGPQDCMLKIVDIGNAGSQELSPGSSAQVGIVQQDGIMAGTYESFVRISYREGVSAVNKTVIIPVSFIVVKKLIKDIEITVSDLTVINDFDDKGTPKKYVKKTVTITNNSDDGEENSLIGLNLSYYGDCILETMDASLCKRRFSGSFIKIRLCDFLRPGESISLDLITEPDSKFSTTLFFTGDNIDHTNEYIHLY